MKMTTQSLFEAIFLDLPVTPAVSADFGIYSQQQYEAYYYAIRRNDITADQFDKALGDGPALTTLLRNAINNPHREIRISTVYDVGLGPEEPEDGEDGVS